jgi:hypothetical protein
MITWIKVARYHLVDRWTYTAAPWSILAFDFAVFMVIITMQAQRPAQSQSGAVAAIYIFFLVIGTMSIGRSLPFALALGVSRRSYYTGTALLAVTLAAAYGLALTALQLIEQATGGWGMNVHFFRVPYLLAGPWYLTWLTSSVGLAVMFAWGMWFGIVYRRWNLIGLLAFTAAQITVLVAGVVITTHADAWPAIGHFFTTLSVVGLTGLLAVLAVLLLAGGYATTRRVTV